MSNDPFFTPTTADLLEATRDDLTIAHKRIAALEALLADLGDWFEDRIDGEYIDGVPHMNIEAVKHAEIMEVL